MNKKVFAITFTTLFVISNTIMYFKLVNPELMSFSWYGLKMAGVWPYIFLTVLSAFIAALVSLTYNDE